MGAVAGPVPDHDLQSDESQVVESVLVFLGLRLEVGEHTPDLCGEKLAVGIGQVDPETPAPVGTAVDHMIELWVKMNVGCSEQLVPDPVLESNAGVHDEPKLWRK